MINFFTSTLKNSRANFCRPSPYELSSATGILRVWWNSIIFLPKHTEFYEWKSCERRHFGSSSFTFSTNLQIACADGKFVWRLPVFECTLEFPDSASVLPLLCIQHFLLLHSRNLLLFYVVVRYIGFNLDTFFLMTMPCARLIHNLAGLSFWEIFRENATRKLRNFYDIDFEHHRGSF